MDNDSKILQEGLAATQASYLYSKRKIEEERSYKKSFRDQKTPEQSTLNEYEEGGNTMANGPYGQYNPSNTTAHAIGMNAQRRARAPGASSTVPNPQTTHTMKPLAPVAPLTPTGGTTPIKTTNVGVIKKSSDNVEMFHQRSAQKQFPGTGPGTGNVIGNSQTRDPDRAAPVAKSPGIFGRIKGLFQDSGPTQKIGRGLNTAEMFGRSKTPTEVTQNTVCNGTTKKMITSEEETRDDSKKNWMQKSVPESHEGRFTEWSKKHGFSGVTSESIAAGKKSDDEHVRKMATLAETFRKHGNK